MIYVIGSGPAGVAAATALLRKGLAVTMLDAGVQMEPELQEVVKRLGSQTPEQWSDTDLRRIKGGVEASASGIPLKYAYGSAFPYAEIDSFIARDATGVGVLPSLARGGLSNVWGAAVLPYPARDLDDWPIGTAELTPYYDKVFSFMGLSARRDELERFFPLSTTQYGTLPVARQTEAFLNDLRAAHQELNAEGVSFGYSRLAVWPQNPAHQSCVACGLCMYGCPYGLIYNASHTLDQLLKHHRFRYVGGVVVQRLIQENGKVSILGVWRGKSTQAVRFEADRVYLGAGVLSTTKIVLESLQAFDVSVTMKDSLYFLLPLVRFKATPGVMQEQLHTLAQLFVEILDERISRRGVHLQVYGYNELFARAIKRQLGPIASCLGLAIRMFLERMLLVQGFLHSDDSNTISVRLRKSDDGRSSRLVLSPNYNPVSKPTLRRVINKLTRCRAWMKAVPISPMLRLGDPGKGFHCGGTFPMSPRPNKFQTDVLGRLPQMPGVHLIDSTVFPSISAATITLTIMANAYRIADTSCAPIEIT